MQKLTLRMETELVHSAKEYASIHGKSLSQLVADYFAELTKQPAAEDVQLPPLTQSLKGVLAHSRDNLDEGVYKKHLEDKYL